jgi:glycosyltransferase involved in cell wall biosynthesis
MRKSYNRQTILHIEAATTYGGSTRCLENFLLNCANNEFRHIVCLYTPLIFAERLKCCCDDLWIIPEQTVQGAKSFKKVFCILSYQTKVAAWLYRQIKINNISLIRLNNGPVAHLGALVAACFSGTPVVAWLRSFPGSGANNILHDWCMRQPMNLIAVSDSVRLAYIRTGVPADKIMTMYDGTKIPQIVHGIPVKKPFCIGTLGRLVSWKGLMNVVRAASLIRDEDVLIRIAGNEDPAEIGFRQQLINEIKRLDLNDKVTLEGFIQDPLEFLLSLDCFINPSFPAEPFGMSIIEAMALGKPVIATDSGGPREIIEQGISGILVEPDSPDALANAIRGIIHDNNKLMKIGINARKRVLDKFEICSLTAEQEHFLITMAKSGIEK